MRSLETAAAVVRPRAARIGRLHARMASALHDLLTELAEFDEDDLWEVDGATDMVSWLGFELGLLPRTARAWLDVARRLDELPELRRCLASGELSLDQVRPLCKIATPEDEADLAAMASEMTAAELERFARKATQIPRKQLVEEEPYRAVEWWWGRDWRFLHIRGKLPAAEGAIVEKALMRVAAEERWDSNGIPFRPAQERHADALVAIAEEALERKGDALRPTLVVHVSAEDLASAEGTAALEHGPVIAMETARRFACDAKWLATLDGDDGTALGVGRRTRRVPRWLSTLVNERDEGCRFPGCGRNRWTHAHHIRHWAEGGSTDLDNLITMCGFHHRKLHNEGWKIRGNPNGAVDWISPFGGVYEPARRLGAKPKPGPEWFEYIDQLHESRIARIRAGPDPG